MTTQPFLEAAQAQQPFKPDAVISVPPRHLAIAQGRSRDHIMAIRVERGPAIGIALVAQTPRDIPTYDETRDYLPRVLVAQIVSDAPALAVQGCMSFFGSKASLERKAYIFHDGSQPGMSDAVIRELKKFHFMTFKPTNTEPYAIDLDTGKPFCVKPTAPIYLPTPREQQMIDACIAGKTYMSGELELLFDLTRPSSELSQKFVLSSPHSPVLASGLHLQ